MENYKILRSWIPVFTLMLYGATGILLHYYVNEAIGDIYIGWGIFGGMLISDHKYSNKVVFWTMLPILTWAYVCIGVQLMFKHPKTSMKRLLVIYKRK